MPTTTHMGLVLPTEDSSDDVWDSLLNTALEEVDAHDHSTGKGVTVKTAGISINADLPFGGFAATALKAMALSAVAEVSVAGYACALFRNTDDDELYWRTAGGVNVQITAGSSLNASLLGGFTGDYGAGDEEAEFSSGTGIYDFRVADTERALIDCADIRLFEKTAGVTNAVKLKSPAALAASYTMTMPTAVPGANDSLLLMATSGALSHTRTPTVTSIATTGTATVGGNLVLSGTQEKTDSYAIQDGDTLVVVDGSSKTVTLPASPATGRVLFIKNDNSGTGLTVDRNGNTIEDSAAGNPVIPADEGRTYIYSGTTWRTFPVSDPVP